MLSKIQMRILFGVLILLMAALTGCVTKSKADAEARAAYVAGQKAAYQSIGAQMTGIVVLGDVAKHEIPWVDGLTLAQALATADYKGMNYPDEIIVKRNSAEMRIDPKKLLNGQDDMALQPGDLISVVGP